MKRLAAFYAIACLITWPLAALIPLSPVLPLLGLFGPAVAAAIVVGRTEGRQGVSALLATLGRWRVGAGWYAVVILLPFALAFAVWAVNALIWGPTPFTLARRTAIDVAVAVLVVGEELGWRGFALPELLRRRTALSASLILGLMWACWHLLNFLIPAYPHYGRSMLAFVIATMAYSVLFTFVFNRTAGSVLVSALFHTAINFISLRGVPLDRQQWLRAGVYGVAALAAVLVAGRELGRPPRPASAPLVAQGAERAL
jgi:membrane protease YdiL (CAAX protease family)